MFARRAHKRYVALASMDLCVRCYRLVANRARLLIERHHRTYCFRPNDSRMVVALGETYEKLERLQEAKKCFWKAHSLGDIEGMALIKLAR